MAPIKSTKGKGVKGKSGGPANKIGAGKSKSAGSKPEGISKRKAKSLSLAKPGGAQKTKSNSSTAGKPKRRTYSEAELDIPKLNGIIPAGIAKPKGQKKGKKFVDDPASMMAIMSVVNAEKQKNVESKIMRARQLEEIREAKRKEAEQRAEKKSAKFEETKKGLKKKKKGRHSDHTKFEGVDDDDKPAKPTQGKKKRVSFG